MSLRRRTASLALGCGWAAIWLGACGGSPGPSSHSSSVRTPAGTPSASLPRSATGSASPAALRLTGRGTLPAPRSGGAAAAFGPEVVFSGGLSSSGTSTATVFTLTRGGASATAGTLPGPVHDAAQAALGGQLLLFGGGRSEGSDRIVRVLPALSRVVGRLPQALSDLDAVVLGQVAYVLGGWNGSETNRSIYAVTLAGSLGSGGAVHLSTVARLPLGVRYPAAAALDGRVIIAGGETTSGTPTSAAWSFDPMSGHVAALPSLPVPTDHAPGAAIGGRFYLFGGLRQGSFTSTILSWAPGERRWRTAGHLPGSVSDAAAVSLPNAIAVLGGRNAGGALDSVTWLGPRPSPPGAGR